MAKEMQYSIVKASMEDRGRVLEFLRRYFYNTEPINAALNKEYHKYSEADERDTLELLQEDTSILALSTNPDDNGSLIGICLSGPVMKEEAERLENMAVTCECDRFSKVLRFLAFVEQEADVWNRSGVSHGLSVQAVAVTPEARGRGVGRALLMRTCDLARQAGYPLFRLDCSSYFSARLAEQMGMECVYTLPYSQYKDQNGSPVFNIESPHLEMRTYIKKF